MDLSRQQRRLVWALALTGIAALIAVGSMICSAILHLPWLMSVVLVAVTIGVAAQIWFIIGFLRDK